MGLLRRSSPRAAPRDEGVWALHESVVGDEPLWVRRNVSLEDRVGDPSRDHLLLVTVEGDIGDPEVLARWGGFEDALFGILGTDESCLPAMVVTKGGARHFLLYTGAHEREKVVHGLAFLKQNFPQEFTPQLNPDPAWAQYARFLPAG